MSMNNAFNQAIHTELNKMTEAHFRTAVIILNWNALDDTKLCIQSLRDSDTPVLIVVVDNASTENGIEDLCELIPGTVLLKNEDNLGFGRGNNVGLKWVLEHTNAEYLLIFNNDARLQSDTIRKLEGHLDNHPEIGGVIPQIVFTDEPDKVWYARGEVDWKRGGGRVRNFRGKIDQDRNPSKVNFATGCAMMLRRKALEQVGGFDPRYFMYEEDIDLSLRLVKSGLWIEYIPNVIVFHRVQGSKRKNNEPFLAPDSPYNPHLSFYMYHMTRNRLLTMYKHARGKNRLQFLTFFPLRWIYKTVQFLLNGRIDAVLAIVSGYLDYRQVRNLVYIDEINGKQYVPEKRVFSSL